MENTSNPKAGAPGSKSQPQKQPQHTVDHPQASQGDVDRKTTSAGRPSKSSDQARRYVQPLVDSSRVVQRPTPRAQIENPRDFQLSQIRRRYAPEQKGDTVLVFDLKPSDPDFPYDMDGLDCALTVPLSYPDERPSLRVRNQDMDRGYQINVERGFQRIVDQNPKSTLLQMLNLLDKQLESLLGAPKAETVKLVANLGKTVAQAGNQSAQTDMITSKAVNLPEPKRSTYSATQKADAAKVRDLETRQLEARLGRLPLFSKSSDGLTYTVPIEVRKKDTLPPSLQAVKNIKLHVPQSYNLEPCSIELVGVEGDEALNVEAAFASRALESSHMSLMNHVNNLSANMPSMARSTVVKTSTPDIRVEEAADTPAKETATNQPFEKSHIVTIPRPPEWAIIEEDEAEDSYDSYSYDTGDETEDEDAPDNAPKGEGGTSQASSSTPERGIMMSFPFLELYSVELLELVSLSITIKCDRCKETMDVSNLKNNEKGDYTGVRSVSCKKCANTLGIGDLVSLTINDLLT